MNYKTMSDEQLKNELQILMEMYNNIKEKGLKLDMSRGKPCPDQLDLTMPMLDVLTSNDILKAENGFDTRNYGILDGIPEAKKLFAEVLDVLPENVIVGGNSSLNMMYDSVARSMIFGVLGGTPWSKLDKVKFLCPAPGYDRHFAITETFGIEMITVPMLSDGPDMDMVEKLVSEDESIKGIWSVPMYSNPTGITYSDTVVKRFASLKPKASDFRIYWDNAYCVHHLTDTPDSILNILEECKENGNDNLVLEFASTSKVSFSGAGVAVMVASVENLNFVRKHLTIQTIGPDKTNQLRHVKFLKDINGVKAHMKNHSVIIAPKFECVLDILAREIDPLDIASYHKPNGGYFISFNTIPGCARRVGELCKNAGVVLTPVGATFPYGVDPEDSNIRIAPTYPPIDELKIAMELFCTCVKIATIENICNK